MRRRNCGSMTRAGESGCPTACRRSARPNATRLNLPLGRLADTLERLAAAGPDDFYTRRHRRIRSPPMCAPPAACCRPKISPAAGRGSCRRWRSPIAARSFQAAPGMTAGADPGLRPRTARPAAFSAAPDAAYFAAVIEALRAAYADRLDQAGDVEAGLPTSTTHITAIDRDGTIAALTTTLAVELWQPLCAARHRHPDEQRRHVVRPASGPAEFDAAGQARADQYVPGRGHARRAAVVRGRRFGRPAHPRRGVADGELCRRFRHGPAGGGAPPADRRQRRRAASASTAACRRRSPDRSARSPARASSSTASSRPGSPARTSCCATMTASITASPT